MALAGSIVGSGILITKNKTQRNLRDAGESFYNLVETIENEVREWVALTRAAALAAVAAGSGEASMGLSGTGVKYSNELSETSRPTGAYTYRCSAEKKTIDFEDPPTP
jgi:hypothetical protein